VADRGCTALHYAAVYGRQHACIVLLDAGATPACVNRAGQMPIDVVSQNPKNMILKNKQLMGMGDLTLSVGTMSVKSDATKSVKSKK